MMICIRISNLLNRWREGAASVKSRTMCTHDCFPLEGEQERRPMGRGHATKSVIVDSFLSHAYVSAALVHTEPPLKAVR